MVRVYRAKGIIEVGIEGVFLGFLMELLPRSSYRHRLMFLRRVCMIHSARICDRVTLGSLFVHQELSAVSSIPS